MITSKSIYEIPLDIVVAEVGENEGLNDFREEDHYRPETIS